MVCYRHWQNSVSDIHCKEQLIKWVVDLIKGACRLELAAQLSSA